MGFINPVTNSTDACLASEHITAPLVTLIITQGTNQTQDGSQMHNLKSAVKKRKREMQDEQAKNTAQQLNPQLYMFMQLNLPRKKIINMAYCIASQRTQILSKHE